MKVETLDATKLDKVVEVMRGLADRRRAQVGVEGGSMYYDLVADCFRRVQTARDEGKYLVAHTIFIPTEFFFAMDIVPFYLEGMCEIIARVNGMEECLSAARSEGFASEICSGHRLVDGTAIKGWTPRPDAFVWSNLVCDLTLKTGDFLSELYDRPGFYLDRPYRYNEDGVQYYVKELEELIGFLENLTGRKMDWDRLKEIMEYSRQATEIFREICELRKSVPSPMRNQHMIEMCLAQLLLSGSPKLVEFYRMVRDEVEGSVERGEGVIPEERHRLLTFFFYPAFVWKLLDAMQNEHGAVIVTEPHLTPWADGEIDPDKPLESLANKAFALVDTGPLQPFLDKVLREAEEYKADGAIYWAHIGCRQTCATMRIIKDALMEQLGIPTLIMDCDLADPTYVSGEQIKDKLEEFFELLDERK
ncbi:MAG: 2-hydroxyacyl-CoA dehydratase [Chloroflexi bacterium]|nr:2-hydroxyacyl-CoA dehydratase [Chloroflexota bacterium]